MRNHAAIDVISCLWESWPNTDFGGWSMGIARMDTVAYVAERALFAAPRKLPGQEFCMRDSVGSLVRSGGYSAGLRFFFRIALARKGDRNGMGNDARPLRRLSIAAVAIAFPIACIGGVMTASSVHGQPVLNAEGRAVFDRDRALNSLIMEHDASQAEGYYDAEFVLTTSSGTMKSKQDMLDEISMPELTLEVNETTDVVVRIRGNTAVLTGILHQRGLLNGKAFDVRLRVTDTWHLTKGKWVILAGHATRL